MLKNVVIFKKVCYNNMIRKAAVSFAGAKEEKKYGKILFDNGDCVRFKKAAFRKHL